MKQSTGIPPIASMNSLFFSVVQNLSPTGTAQHANQLSPINNSPTKSVSFKRVVSVILIPEIKEFKDAGIAEQIWSTRDDFKLSLIEKIDMIISKYPHLSEKEAYKQLYLYDEETDQATETPRPGV